MSESSARAVTSNQDEPHERIAELVARHLNAASQKPFSEHTLNAYAEAKAWLGESAAPLILDSCCGVGESTAKIAAAHPQAKVIGIDKSAHRLDKHPHYGSDVDNYLVLRADLNDFWRLAAEEGWQLSKHFLLYPNPYPKSSQVHKRWHASSAFPSMLALGGEITVRSNWQVYVEEFALALKCAGHSSYMSEYSAAEPMTPFERKYWQSGQSSWQLEARLQTANRHN